MEIRQNHNPLKSLAPFWNGHLGTSLSVTSNTYYSVSGGQLYGRLDALGTTTGSAGIRLTYTGVTPSSPGHGDLWVGGSTFYWRGASGTYQLAHRNSDNAFSAKQTFATPTTSIASLNLPHGTAPSSPSNGDVWSTSSGWYFRTNGTTHQMATVAAVAAGYQPLATNLTTVAGLSDPNADRIMFWDDSAGAITWLAPSTGLSISGTNLAVATASETTQGIVELATTAEASAGTDTTRAITAAGMAAAMTIGVPFLIPSRLQTVCRTITDWNDANENGFWMGNAATNGPSASWYYGQVTVHNSSWITQTVIGFTQATDDWRVTYRRDYRNGTWANWSYIYQTKAEILDNTIEGYATYVDNQSTTSGSSKATTGIGVFKIIKILFSGVSGTATADIRVELSDNNGTGWTTPVVVRSGASAASTTSGCLTIYCCRMNSTAKDMIMEQGGSYQHLWSDTISIINGIRVSLSTGTFDAGSYRIVGIR